TFVVERLVDVAAKEMGIDRVELRRRNIIPKEAYPYQTPVLVEYDSGDPMGCLEGALAAADVAGFAERKAASERDGKFRGLGYSTYVEACGLALCRTPRCPRRPLRKRHGPGASDRTGDRADRHP